jgi:hypothetical protein
MIHRNSIAIPTALWWARVWTFDIAPRNSVRSSMFIATEMREHELRQEFHVSVIGDYISLLTE